MYRTIIVPIDLSQEGKGRDAIALARQLGGADARIVLVHVLEEIPAYVAHDIPEGVLEQSREKAGQSMHAIAAETGIEAEIEVLRGHPANRILELAEKAGADLIIVASHRPGLQDYFIGSTAGRVVRHALCSVLVTR